MEPKNTFQAIRERQTVERFSSRKLPDQLLYELLDLANSAPSGFNMQPWHFIVVRDADLKEMLSHISLQDTPVLAAPCMVVFVADPQAWRAPYDEILSRSVAAGLLSAEQAAELRKNVNRLFSTDPFGLFGVIKRITLPVQRLLRPVPQVMTSSDEVRTYARAHTMLAAATFLIAASAAGLASCPVEAFDEERLKKLLAIPAAMTVPLIAAIGYPLEDEKALPQIRLPLLEKLSVDLFPNKLSKLKRDRDDGWRR